MSLEEDLKSEVADIFRKQWSKRDGNVVPESDSLQLSNDALEIEGVVLYADISGSTNLVNQHNNHFAAEIYKTFLHCAAKVIRDESGEITAYDGDRIMAVFIGDFKNTCATRTALKVNYCVKNIVCPALKRQYP